ncbi:hypothetical protein V6N13_123748 [Hibiscus sabdariffa]
MQGVILGIHEADDVHVVGAVDDQKILQMISLNARKYAVEYVEKHGWPAFERIINAAEKEAKKHQVYAVSTAAIPFYHWIVKECLCLYI